MGRGWRLGILDDLLKGRAAADSEGPARYGLALVHQRISLSRAQGSMPRRKSFSLPRAGILDDPAARIRRAARGSGAEAWRILNFAALDEDDNALAEDLRPASRAGSHRRGML